MKYILSFFAVVIVCMSFTFFKTDEKEANCFCVCIISNSKSENDETIKFAVKDKISSFINKRNNMFDEENIDDIAFLTNQVLSVYHCGYNCDIEVKDEKLSNLNFVNQNYNGKVCKTFFITLGKGDGVKSWQVFFE